MAFAIEVPGEANPLTPRQVFLALQSAGSSQQLLIQTGTQQLQTWEIQRGYFPLLHTVYLDKSLPTEIRSLAIIQLKNGIDKYWRKYATNAICDEDKLGIRAQLFRGGIEEPETRLAKQNALVISKIVRSDYPLAWSDALPDLIKTVRAANGPSSLHLQRALLMLLQVIKELLTARMVKSRQAIESIVPEIVSLLVAIWTQKVENWLAFLQGGAGTEDAALEALESSLYCIKILRRLLVSGYASPHLDKGVQEFWQLSQVQFGLFLSLPGLPPNIQELVDKHLIQFSKLHVGMSETNPTAFALLPNSLDLVRAYWGLVSKFGETFGSATQDFGSQALDMDADAKDEKPAQEKLCLKGLVLFRKCILMAYKPKRTIKFKSEETKIEEKRVISLVKAELLTDELVGQVANTILTKFFVFRQADLVAWEQDEDEWEHQEAESGDDTYEFEIRPCAERLFTDLVINYKSLLVGPLLSFFQSVAGDESNVVTKDSVYSAMGLAAPAIFQEFDFEAFLTSTLVNDVQQCGPGYKVLRRRIAILLGQWITIKISEETRPLVYQIFQHLLKIEDDTNDHVVRVTAARQFKNVVDDFEFRIDGFLPYAPDIITRLMALVQEVELTETKLAVLATLQNVALRMEHHIEPFANSIVSLLPALWEASGEEHVIKQNVLMIFTTLVISMKAESQRYHKMILPLIRGALDPGSEMQVYLLDEALDLWEAVLAQTAAPASPDVTSLIECTFPLLELGTEHLRATLDIVKSYVILAPEMMLGDATRLRVISYMASLLGRVSKRELAGSITTIVEDLIRSAEALGGSNGVSLIAKDLHESGYTEILFRGLRDAWEAHETSGPNTRYPELEGPVETDYFNVLARIALADPSVFMTILVSVGDLNEVWSWLSTEWFHHFDCMANVEHQKLSCLALTRLLELPSPVTPMLLGKLQDYFAMWTSVVSEILDQDGNDTLVWGPSVASEGEGPQDRRNRLYAWADPVHRVHAFNVVKERLGVVVEGAGGEAAFAEGWAASVDGDVLKGFRDLGLPREDM